MSIPLDFTNFQNLGTLILRDIRDVESEEALTLKGGQVVYSNTDTDSFFKAGNEQVTNIAPVKNFVFAMNKDKNIGNWFTTEIFRKNFNSDDFGNKNDLILPAEHSVFNESGSQEDKHKSTIKLAMFEDNRELPREQSFLALDEGDMVQAGTLHLSKIQEYSSALLSSGINNENIGSLRNSLVLVAKSKLTNLKENRRDNLTPAYVMSESPDGAGYGLSDFSGVEVEEEKTAWLSAEDSHKGFITFGNGCTKHIHQDTNIQGAHIATGASFFRNPTEDGSLKFDKVFKRGSDAPIIRKVHLAWGGHQWEWWTSESVEMPTEDEEEEETTRRGKPPVPPTTPGVPSQPNRPENKPRREIDKDKPEEKPKAPEKKKSGKSGSAGNTTNPIVPPVTTTGGKRGGNDVTHEPDKGNSEPLPIGEDDPKNSPSTKAVDPFPDLSSPVPYGTPSDKDELEKKQGENQKAQERENEKNRKEDERDGNTQESENTAEKRAGEARRNSPEENDAKKIEEYLEKYTGLLIRHELGGLFRSAEEAGDLRVLQLDNGKFLLYVHGRPVLFASEEAMMHYLNVGWLHDRMSPLTPGGFNWDMEHCLADFSDELHVQQARMGEIISPAELEFFNSNFVEEIPEILTNQGVNQRGQEEVLINLLGRNNDEYYPNPTPADCDDNDSKRSGRKFGRQKQTASPSWEIVSAYDSPSGYNPDYSSGSANDLLRYIESDGADKRNLSNFRETVISTMFGIASGSPEISKEYDEFMSSGTVFLAPADCVPWNLSGDLHTTLNFTLHQDRASLNFGLGNEAEVTIQAEAGSSDYNLRITPSNSIVLDIPDNPIGLNVGECYWDFDILKRVI